MPQMADLVPKKNDGTTDITYTAVQPSSGDGIYAVWKSMSVGNAQAHQPELRFMGRDASQGKSRETRATMVYPQIATNTTTGVTSVIDKAFGSANFSFPKTMANSDVNEFVSQFCNALKLALIQSCIKQGVGPT